MNFNVKVCDYCAIWIYEGEYEIRNGEIICFLCVREEEENDEEQKISVG